VRAPHAVAASRGRRCACRYLARRFTVIIPWYPTGTMERIQVIGEVATASTLARMLSITPPASSGSSQLCIFDLHALQELFYFTDHVNVCEPVTPMIVRCRRSRDACVAGARAQVRLKSCISLLKLRLERQPDQELLSGVARASLAVAVVCSTRDACCVTAVAFPDEGAYKRFHKKFSEYPVVCRSRHCSDTVAMS
jgi:hypothetical protein